VAKQRQTATNYERRLFKTKVESESDVNATENASDFEFANLRNPTTIEFEFELVTSIVACLLVFYLLILFVLFSCEIA